MKPTKIPQLVSLILFSIPAVAHTAPEPPSLWREVTGVRNISLNNAPTPVHTRPHVPAFRTSVDGRVALRVLTKGEFALMLPEKLTEPVRTIQNERASDNSYVMSSTDYKYVDGCNEHTNARNFYKVPPGSKGALSHFTLFDPTPLLPTAGEITNPSPENGEDVYQLKVLGIYNYEAGDPTYPGKMQIFVTPVKVYVSNPKTAAAKIRSIQRIGEPKGGPIYPFQADGREPNIVGDGRLLVLRISSRPLPWQDPVTKENHPAVTGDPAQSVDIVYSYYNEGEAANPTGWDTLLPITHAPYDTRINTKFGFAMAPFRDATGKTIPDGEDLGGTYPWIDRQGKNLFFTVANETLRYGPDPKNVKNSRYPWTTAPGEPLDYLPEESGITRGVCFAGLWSHGKIVMLDNLNNDMDYAMGSSKGFGARMVQLFEANGVHAEEREWLYLGGGRVNDVNMPSGDNRNSTILDSLENLFNYRKFAAPISVRDVVWPIHNAKNSDDLVFDHYLDADAFIVAEMSGVAAFDTGATTKVTKNQFKYHSGWNTKSKAFDLPVKLQNAATATSDRWVVPECGLVTRGGRLEPAATGGIHGKGFWMDGQIGLAFAVKSQPQDVSKRDWYAGVFVDCRHENDSTVRELITFPDGTAIRLLGRNQIQYIDRSGNLARSVPLPPIVEASLNESPFADLLPDNAWAHLAWQIRAGGKDVEFLLNGLPFDRYAASAALFQLTPGTLTFGKTPNGSKDGFRGWIDEVLVLAHTVDPETACNNAGGTLIGLPAGYTGPWQSLADCYPDFAHEQISRVLRNNGEKSYPTYANFYDYRKDYGAHLGNIPVGTVSLRQGMQFPEGPLFANAPRPDSTRNRFCTTCHVNGGSAGLTLAALELRSELAPVDPRRQPLQPAPRLFGNIPAGLIDRTELPASRTVLGPGGQNIDEWLLPKFKYATVNSFTLTDASKEELVPLSDGDTIHLSDYNVPAYSIRANLDSAQGTVSLSFDGDAASTPDRIPYATKSGRLSVGNHTLTATPKNGASVTIHFTVK